MNLNFWRDDHQEVPVSEGRENIYQKLARLVVLIGAGLFLLFFLPWSSSPLEVNKQLFLILFSGLALVFWLMGIVTSGYLKWRPFGFLKPMAIIAAAAILATVFSVSRFKSLFGLTNSLSDSLSVILALSVMALLVVNVFDDRGKKLQSVILVALGISFIYSILQIFGIYILRFPLAKNIGFNTIGSINTLGVLAAASLSFIYKSGFNLPLVKYISYAAFISALFILVILNWWILWTIAIIGMFVLVALESLNSKGFKISKSVIPLTVIVLGFFLITINFRFTYFSSKMPLEVAPSFGLSSKVAQSVIKDRPVFGYGLENFSLAFDRYGSQALANTNFSSIRFYDSTSEFFNSIVQGGIVLGLAFLLLFAWIIWEIFKFYKRNPMSVEGDHVGVMAMVLTMAAAFFLYPFNISLLFFLYLSIAMASLSLWGRVRSYLSIEKSPILSLASSLSFIGGLVLVLVAFYFSLLFYSADIKYVKAAVEPDKQKSVVILTEAIKWNGNDDKYYRLLSQKILALLSEEMSKPNDPQKTNLIQNYTSSTIRFAQKASQMDPRESLNWANLGNTYKSLLMITDNVDKLAEDAYLKAAELRPGDANFYYQIGSMYLAKGDLLIQMARANPKAAPQLGAMAGEAYKKSEDALKKAVDTSNNFGMAIYNLGTVYEREGMLGEAIKQLEKLAPANANQPGLMFELGLLYYRAGRKDDAISQLQKAIILAPDYANARWYLALIYEERNDISSAIAHLEKILSIDVNKDNPIVLQKLQEMKSGKRSIPPGKVLDQKPL